MGCHQSIPSQEPDSDGDSTSDTILFEKVPFKPSIATVPSRSSLTPSRPSSNLNNMGNNMKFENLHKINVTTNGTLSPISQHEFAGGFPNTATPLPSVQDEASNQSSASRSIKAEKKVSISIDKMLTPAPNTPSNSTYSAPGLRYRTKKVTIYKPHLQPKTDTELTPNSRHSHTRETSKDDLDITLHLSMKRKSLRTKHNAKDPRLSHSANRLSIKRESAIFCSYHMQYDLGCVTDIEDESDDEYDNVTVVRHDSSANYESDDSFWDAHYISNRSKNSSVSHRRKATYHAYGGDDDAANKTDSESGIGAEFDDEDELSDASLNRMARIATGFNEDHPLAHGTEQEDDETDIETAHYDHLHQSTGTTTHSNEDRKPPITKQISTGSDETCSLNDGSERMRSTSTSSSLLSAVDKSSISIQQIDKAAFLQKILRNSINKHKVLKDEEQNQRMKKEKELKLQETHRTSNIKVIDDNTIAINIGISKVYNDAPLPEGNEDEHYENQSVDSEDTDTDTDTDPETAMLDFGQIARVNSNVMSDETSDENVDMQQMKVFRIMEDGVRVFQDVGLKDEIFSVRLKEGEEVQGEYSGDAQVVLLYKTKLYASIGCVMEVTDHRESAVKVNGAQNMDQLMKDEKEAMNKLKQILQKINESNANDAPQSSHSAAKVSPPSSQNVSPKSETSTESVSSPERMVMEPIHSNMKPPPIVIGIESEAPITDKKATDNKSTKGKRGSAKKRTKARPRASTTTDIVHKASMKRVTIRKGKRKKKTKRKKMISATPPPESVSPRFFSKKDMQKEVERQKSETVSVRSMDSMKPDGAETPTRPESPIIAKYKDQLVEHKEQILQMIEGHKRRKRERQKQYTQSMTEDIRPIQTRTARAQTADTIITKRPRNTKEPKVFVTKKKLKRPSWKRSGTESRIHDVPSPVAASDNTDVMMSRMSFKQRMKKYQEHTSGMGKAVREKVNDIKAERKRSDSNASINEEQKRKASHLLQDYANKKAKHIADVTLIAKSLKRVTKENCVQKLEALGILTYVYVPMNEFERWNHRNNISNRIDIGDDNKDQYMKHPKEYIRMANITLLNSKILIKLAEEQKESFKRLILFGIEQCRLIYKMNFNAANITNAFLDKILKAIAMRNEMIVRRNDTAVHGMDGEDKEVMYGPELLLIENNPISDRGIEMICKHVGRNDGVHLKCLKVGHCFGTISTSLCAAFCESLQNNEFILKVTFDMRWKQHRSAVDKALKQNYTRYRALQKKYKKTLKMKTKL